MIRTLTGLILISTVATALVSCGSSSSSSTKEFQADIFVEAIDQTVIPSVDNFVTQSAKLKKLSNEFCAAASRQADNLQKAKAQWKETAKAWYRLQPYNMGPSDNDPVEPEYIFIDSLRLRGLNNIGVVRSDLNSMIASSSSLAPSTFSNKIYTQVGLLAAEVALFESTVDQSKDNTDILSDYTNKPRKCLALVGYTSELARRAKNIQTGWKVNYKSSGKSYRDLLINNRLGQVDNDVSGGPGAELIISTNGYMDYTHKRTILNKAGSVADYAWEMVEASVLSIETLINGTSATSESLADRLQKNAPQDLQTIRSNIQLLKQAINAKNSTDYYAAALALDGNIKRDLKDGLGITTGINFSDGD